MTRHPSNSNDAKNNNISSGRRGGSSNGTSNMPSRVGRDPWNLFRDRKLDEMKIHKLNVERRMRAAQNIDSQMYWSQRSDKLKRYPKHEALDPSWYTDNIYANSSIDLDDEDCTARDTEKYDAFYPYNDYGINDYVHDMFERRKAYHRQHVDNGDYNYPKSRSCCFGSGYDERPKLNLMPKSSSFSAPTTTRATVHAGRHPYRIDEEEDFHEHQRQTNDDFGQSSIRKLYCWKQRQQQQQQQQRQQRHDDSDNERRKEEIYHIDGDASNVHCARNMWQHSRHAPPPPQPSLPPTTNFKMNNNALNRHDFHETYDDGAYNFYRKKIPLRNGYQHHSFDEEYLIVHQNKSLADHYSHSIRRNYSDDMISISRRQSQHYDDECTKLLNNDDDDDAAAAAYERNANLFNTNDLNRCHRNSMKSKTALEVTPPNRYDESSSDSTDLELDDFNFDFEKYWNELDKLTTSSSSGTIIAGNVNVHRSSPPVSTLDRYDCDYRDSMKCNFIKNTNQTTATNFKEKNINVDKYEKNRGQNIVDVNLNDIDIDSDVGDDDDDDVDDDDEDDVDNCIDDIDIIDEDDLMMDYRERPRLVEHFCSPQHKPSTSLRSRYSSNDRYARTYHRQPTHNTIDDPINNTVINKSKNNNNVGEPTASRGSGTGSGAISLINNIFSIYKPRKYSPVNCRAAATATTAPPLPSATSSNHPKSRTISKCMNVASTVRPLGMPYNDYMSSMKRPLIITPTCHTSKRAWTGPSATVDVPHFKIIPQKTGLKISPLYRFGFDDFDDKLRLKCTARPLLFPI